MPEITLLTEPELRQAIELDADAVECIESAFATLASGGVIMPPILSMVLHDKNGEVDVKTAYVPGIDSFAIKVAPGFFDNVKLGLPSMSGLMMLFSSNTGRLEALLLDNGYLTDVRTAAAGAVAAKHLANHDVAHACIVGAGAQARLQLKALCLVRPISQATVWARNPERAAAAADELANELGIAVTASPDLQASVSGAQVIVTATPSHQPLIQADWLRPGQHITAMGSDQDHKNELHPECLRKATCYVPDRRSQTEVLGELHHALRAGTANEDTGTVELCDIVAGAKAGRESPDAITICDLTGTGLQDTAIATLARTRALAAGAGTTFSS